MRFAEETPLRPGMQWNGTCGRILTQIFVEWHVVRADKSRANFRKRTKALRLGVRFATKNNLKRRRSIAEQDRSIVGDAKPKRWRVPLQMRAGFCSGSRRAFAAAPPTTTPAFPLSRPRGLMAWHPGARGPLVTPR